MSFDWTSLLVAGLQIAPNIVHSVQTVSAGKAVSGEQKAQAALAMAQTGIQTALGLSPSAFGPAEVTLIRAVNDAVVAYYNARGWPVTPPPLAAGATAPAR